ncbi:LTA synthase family protein [Bombilactobacillus bombi]|uniref:LTA synthase family protein n=1 Tax=Bombilactobacillus bombi TaxID=1303590 RepID=A0A3R6XSC3_9LACO|nr:LTA synthase family protein [Bombilactobacillus bombi]RHW47291.1 LTA synthase family protein [Bombilactobacillus bombi]
MMTTKLKQLLKQRTGWILLLVIFIWIKTVIAYYLDFNMGAMDPLQHFLMILNPIASTLLLMSLTLYFKKPSTTYITAMIIYLLETILLYSNILYYREFNDFISFNTIMSVGKVSKGLGSSAIAMAQAHDWIYFVDFAVIIILFFTKKIKIDHRPYSRLQAFTVTSIALFGLVLNLFLAELSRPQLLVRTFDRTYIVKYLGLNSFLTYDGLKTAQSNSLRSGAQGTSMDPVLKFVNQNYAAPNPQYAGVGRGKNVIIIHLESFQQFLIDSKVKDQEVTPFLNSLYHDDNTLSFSNFFHEVGQGKTSDAETMLETSLFGLPEGSFFTSLGTNNTFQAAPAILDQQQGYTSAVFHGNIGSFWSRDTVYKNMGYHYFFDQKYYQQTADSNTYWGSKDKLLFSESVKYLEQLQQPFYAKFLTVTNHNPYELSDTDTEGFEKPDTPNTMVNNYFATAHYLDEALREFFDYLKASGLYNNSIVVLYGDHFGLNEGDEKALAPLLNRDPDTWTTFDHLQLQRVPFMIHMPGLKGGIQKQYGGEIDALPTLLHLLGVNTKPYIFMGTDLLSPQHNQNVIFRNHSFVTPKYTVVNSNNDKLTIYQNSNGELLTNPDPLIQKRLQKISQQKVNELELSDMINKTNLLRFYTPAGFKPVNPKNYNYQNQYQQLLKIRNNLGEHSTSLFSKNGNKSTTGLYKTNAPELQNNNAALYEIPQLNNSPNNNPSSK